MEFRLATQWHGDCLPAVADELEVTERLLEVWVETRQRRHLVSPGAGVLVRFRLWRNPENVSACGSNLGKDLGHESA